jgi:hypothetical protein
MKRITKYTLVAVVSISIGAQLIPVERSNPAVDLDLDAPIEVKAILKRSCYDCHSNEVDWPWYSYVAPISWLVAHDVNEGREELNFSEWNKHSSNTEMKEEIIEEIEEGKMPLPIYLITHSDAAITEKELATLKQWAGYSGHSHGDDHE